MGTEQETTLDDLTYEEAFANLETIIAGLESGELPLEEALARYEEGVKLAARCATLLEEAELRVRAWQLEGGTAGIDGRQTE
jgi:exodeoxyribonuclease VII small subunit